MWYACVDEMQPPMPVMQLANGAAAAPWDPGLRDRRQLLDLDIVRQQLSRLTSSYKKKSNKSH